MKRQMPDRQRERAWKQRVDWTKFYRELEIQGILIVIQESEVLYSIRFKFKCAVNGKPSIIWKRQSGQISWSIGYSLVKYSQMGSQKDGRGIQLEFSFKLCAVS